MPIIPVALLVAQASPTFDQIEALKHTAYRQLADYREVIKIEVRGDGKTNVLTLQQRIQGPKQRLVALINGNKYLESGHDGVKGWAITHASKQYKLWQGANANYVSKYKPPDRKKDALGSFNFLFDNGYNIRFTSNPPLKVLSSTAAVLDGKPARKIVAKAVIEEGKRYIQVTQWFYPDKWIMRRFEIEGKGKTTGVFKVVGQVMESSFAAASAPGMFRLDPKLVRGYTLIKN